MFDDGRCVRGWVLDEGTDSGVSDSVVAIFTDVWSVERRPGNVAFIPGQLASSEIIGRSDFQGVRKNFLTARLVLGYNGFH